MQVSLAIQLASTYTSLDNYYFGRSITLVSCFNNHSLGSIKLRCSKWDEGSSRLQATAHSLYSIVFKYVVAALKIGTNFKDCHNKERSLRSGTEWITMLPFKTVRKQKLICNTIYILNLNISVHSVSCGSVVITTSPFLLRQSVTHG